MKNYTQVTVRLDDAMLARLDAIREHYAAKLGMDLVRTDAIRMAATRGIDAIEAEMVSAPAKKAKK